MRNFNCIAMIAACIIWAGCVGPSVHLIPTGSGTVVVKERVGYNLDDRYYTCDENLNRVALIGKLENHLGTFLLSYHGVMNVGDRIVIPGKEYVAYSNDKVIRTESYYNTINIIDINNSTAKMNIRTPVKVVSAIADIRGRITALAYDKDISPPHIARFDKDGENFTTLNFVPPLTMTHPDCTRCVENYSPIMLKIGDSKICFVNLNYISNIGPAHRISSLAIVDSMSLKTMRNIDAAKTLANNLTLFPISVGDLRPIAYGNSDIAIFGVEHNRAYTGLQFQLDQDNFLQPAHVTLVNVESGTVKWDRVLNPDGHHIRILNAIEDDGKIILTCHKKKGNNNTIHLITLSGDGMILSDNALQFPSDASSKLAFTEYPGNVAELVRIGSKYKMFFDIYKSGIYSFEVGLNGRVVPGTFSSYVLSGK